jgi:hypothetical protein
MGPLSGAAFKVIEFPLVPALLAQKSHLAFQRGDLLT